VTKEESRCIVLAKLLKNYGNDMIEFLPSIFAHSEDNESKKR